MERALLAALLACALVSAGSAQPVQPRQGGYDDEAAADQDMRVSTAMIALLAAVIAVFVFIVASIIYLRHCTGYSYARSAGPADARQPTGFSSFIARRQQRRAATSRGLAAEVVEAFPTMRYAEAKALRVGKKAAPPLECAVCLSEFEDEDRLRLLPKCSHAFHPDCIGEWLVSHVTCPVCRRNLDPSKGAGSDDDTSNPNPNPPAPLEANSASSAVVRHHQADGVARPSAVVIDDVVTEEEAEQRRKEAMELQRIGTQRRAMRSRSRPAGAKAKAKLVRSYSTGHPLAVVRLDRDLERFTLRLPEHVRREMVASGEQSAHRRGQRAGRWPSFLRYTQTLSGRFCSTPRRTDSTDGGEASSTSWTRIRGNRVAAVDVVDGSAMGGSVAVDVDKAASRQVRT